MSRAGVELDYSWQLPVPPLLLLFHLDRTQRSSWRILRVRGSSRLGTETRISVTLHGS